MENDTNNVNEFSLHEIISDWIVSLPEDEYEWLKSDDVSPQEILDAITNSF